MDEREVLQAGPVPSAVNYLLGSPVDSHAVYLSELDGPRKAELAGGLLAALEPGLGDEPTTAAIWALRQLGSVRDGEVRSRLRELIHGGGPVRRLCLDTLLLMLHQARLEPAMVLPEALDETKAWDPESVHALARLYVATGTTNADAGLERLVGEGNAEVVAEVVAAEGTVRHLEFLRAAPEVVVTADVKDRLRRRELIALLEDGGRKLGEDELTDLVRLRQMSLLSRFVALGRVSAARAQEAVAEVDASTLSKGQRRSHRKLGELRALDDTTHDVDS